jgi:hypothetical protein
VTVSFPAAPGSYGVVSWNAGCANAGFCGTATNSLSGVNRVATWLSGFLDRQA